MVVLGNLRTGIVVWSTIVIGSMFSTPAYSQQAPPPQSSSFSFVSEPGDPIGEGQSVTTDRVQAFSLYDTFHREIEVYVLYTAGNLSYVLLLQAPEGEVIQPGRYDGAVLYGSDRTRPGMSLESGTFGCDTIDGRFTVHQITRGYGENIERLRVTFEQQCNGAPGRLTGEVTIRNPREATAGGRLPKVELDIERAWLDQETGRLYLRGSYTCESQGWGRILVNVAASQRQRNYVETYTSGGATRLYFCNESPEPITLGLPIGGFREGILHLTFRFDIGGTYFSSEKQVVRVTDQN